MRSEKRDEGLRGLRGNLETLRGVIPLRQLAPMQSRSRARAAFAAKLENLRQFQCRLRAVATAKTAAPDGVLDAQMHRGIDPDPRLDAARFRDANILRENGQVGVLHQRERYGPTQRERAGCLGDDRRVARVERGRESAYEEGENDFLVKHMSKSDG